MVYQHPIADLLIDHLHVPATPVQTDSDPCAVRSAHLLHDAAECLHHIIRRQLRVTLVNPVQHENTHRITYTLQL